MTTIIEGSLEIDHERGVIYFHCEDTKRLVLYGPTPLRICQLPKPIPQFTEHAGLSIDITHMHGVSYKP